MAPISDSLGGFLLHGDRLGRLSGFSDPSCVCGLTFASQALRPAPAAIELAADKSCRKNVERSLLVLKDRALRAFW